VPCRRKTNISAPVPGDQQDPQVHVQVMSAAPVTSLDATAADGLSRLREELAAFRAGLSG